MAVTVSQRTYERVAVTPVKMRRSDDDDDDKFPPQSTITVSDTPKRTSTLISRSATRSATRSTTRLITASNRPSIRKQVALTAALAVTSPPILNRQSHKRRKGTSTPIVTKTIPTALTSTTTPSTNTTISSAITPATTNSLLAGLPEIQDEIRGELDSQDEEYKAFGEACLALNIDDAILFSTNLLYRQTQEMVGKLVLSLSHEDSRMAAFAKMVRATVDRADAAVFQAIESDPQTNARIDSLWDEAIAGEQQLFHSGMEVPAGLDTRLEYLVKPFGSLTDLLLVISSYLTADVNSSVQLNYAMTNDLSHMCMSQLYAKAGYHNI